MFRQFGLPGDEIGSCRSLILRPLPKGCCRREIVLIGVLPDCTIGRKGRCQAGHTFAHASNPSAWNSVLVARIELRDNFFLEYRIKTLRFSCVPGGVIPMFAPISDRPAYFRGIRLCPPSIELRKIQPAVHQHLHAACAACFPWPTRSVHPDVHALNQMLRHENVVVRKEGYPGSNFKAASKLKPLPDHFLPLGILGMGLASK